MGASVDTIKRMRARPRTTALVLSLVVAGALLVATAHETSAFRGMVVDGDTGEPLERAVVVVVWHRSALVALDSRTVVDKAIERLTGSRGEFSENDSPPLLSLGFKKREVMIFKPGYHTLTGVTYDHRAPLFGEQIIRLKKIRTLGEARQRSNTTQFLCPSAFPPHDFCVPEARLPNLMRILKVESRIYDAYPADRSRVEEDQ